MNHDRYVQLGHNKTLTSVAWLNESARLFAERQAKWEHNQFVRGVVGFIGVPINATIGLAGAATFLVGHATGSAETMITGAQIVGLSGLGGTLSLFAIRDAVTGHGPRLY